MTQQKQARNPGRIVKEEQIPLRLMRAELDDAQRIAKKHGISKSAIGRRAYRLGLPILMQQLQNMETA